MALSLSEFLSGAGVASSSMRRAEEAERVARQNQLAIEERNRLDQLRQEMLRAPMPQVPAFQFNMGTMPVRQIAAPAAAPAAPGLVQPMSREQAAFLEANVEYPPFQAASTRAARAVPTPDGVGRMAATSVSELPPGVERLGVAFEEARAAYRTAQAKLDRYGSRQRQADPAGYQQARMDAMRAEQAMKQAQQLYETAASPLLGAVQVQPRPPVPARTAPAPAAAPAPAPAPAAAVVDERKVGADVQAQREQEAAKIRAQELGTAARAQAELARLDNEIKRTKDGEARTILRAERARVDAARQLLESGAAVGSSAGLATAAEAAPAPALAPAAPAPAPAAAAPTVAEPQVKTSAVYLKNPAAITEDMRRATQQREELARLAQMYQNAGMGAQFMETRAKIMEMDNNMIYLHGMRGIEEFSLAGDPRRLTAVWSAYFGAPVGVQRRSDGLFDVIADGERVLEGLTPNAVMDRARSSFDTAFRKQKAEAGASASMERFKADLEVEKDRAKQLAQMIREVAVARVQGNTQLALEQLKQFRYDVKPTGAGDGTVIITPPGGANPYLFNPSGKTIEIDGVKIQSNAAYPITGLPSYGGTRP